MSQRPACGGDDNASRVCDFGPAQTNGAPLAWANPANIAFDTDGRRLLVTNHASLVNPPNTDLFAIFDVYVNDKAGKMFSEFKD